MLKAIMFFVLIAVSFIANFSDAHATAYQVDNTKLYIYAQSDTESDAHLVRSSVGIYQGGEHPQCGNRAYIDFKDKDLFATALAASISGKSVNFFYEDAAPSKTIAGHTTTTCRIYSIWW